MVRWRFEFWIVVIPCVTAAKKKISLRNVPSSNHSYQGISAKERIGKAKKARVQFEMVRSSLSTNAIVRPVATEFDIENMEQQSSNDDISVMVSPEVFPELA